MTSFEVTTHVRTELLDITDKVRDAVAQSQVGSGMCFVYVPHTTAGVTVNESYDSDVARDITEALSKLVPHRGGYAHSEGNSDAHIKAAMVGSCQAMPVEDGRLTLGRWQGVFFCEFDGPRQRRVQVQVTGK
ncbi:YjbQ family protein [candidate division WOR-3 bacterium]|uniref:YjbQ family protein n=1 Tax=candidate division WOR-3 bacterium TaxID=2052148 RepID=A0A938BSX0_UNCW3|nr:YjbQ family protein [candidate division WOR-3 bacterium]